MPNRFQAPGLIRMLGGSTSKPYTVGGHTLSTLPVGEWEEHDVWGNFTPGPGPYQWRYVPLGPYRWPGENALPSLIYAPDKFDFEYTHPETNKKVMEKNLPWYGAWSIASPQIRDILRAVQKGKNIDYPSNWWELTGPFSMPIPADPYRATRKQLWQHEREQISKRYSQAYQKKLTELASRGIGPGSGSIQGAVQPLQDAYRKALVGMYDMPLFTHETVAQLLDMPELLEDAFNTFMHDLP